MSGKALAEFATVDAAEASVAPGEGGAGAELRGILQAHARTATRTRLDKTKDKALRMRSRPHRQMRF